MSNDTTATTQSVSISGVKKSEFDDWLISLQLYSGVLVIGVLIFGAYRIYRGDKKKVYDQQPEKIMLGALSMQDLHKHLQKIALFGFEKVMFFSEEKTKPASHKKVDSIGSIEGLSKSVQELNKTDENEVPEESKKDSEQNTNQPELEQTDSLKLDESEVKKKSNFEHVKEYFSWFYLFWAIGIDEVTLNCGLDTQIYLTFMNYSAWFLFITALLTNCCLLPLFHQSTEESKLLETGDKDPWTLGGSVDDQRKMWAVFVVTCLIGVLGHVFIYLFEGSTKSITDRYQAINKYFLSQSAIAENTIVIRGINTELSVQEGQKKLKPFFKLAHEVINNTCNFAEEIQCTVNNAMLESKKHKQRTSKLIRMQSFDKYRQFDDVIKEYVKYKDPISRKLITDFNKIMPIKAEMEKNGLKNEFYKKNFWNQYDENEKQNDEDDQSDQDGDLFETKQREKDWLNDGYEVARQHIYLRKYNYLKKQMNEHIRHTTTKNFGICYVMYNEIYSLNMFKDSFQEIKNFAREQVCVQKTEEKEDTKSKQYCKIVDCFKCRCEELHVQSWVIEQAPMHSNIIWDNIFNRREKTVISAIVINLLVFILAMTLITPASLFAVVQQQQMIDGSCSVLNNTEDQSFYCKVIYPQIGYMLVIFINFIVVPQIIDFSSYYLGFELKSDRHSSNFIKHFGFLFISTFLIPLLGISSFDKLLTFFSHSDFDDFSSSVLQNSYYFLKSITSVGFVTNTYYLMDLPHLMYVWLQKKTQKQPEYAEKLVPNTEVVDDYYFDLGFYYAYSCVIFSTAVFLSCVSPLIPLMAFVFFIIKYNIDKYNFMYLYPGEFETVSSFGTRVAWICTFTIFFFQLFMFLLFIKVFGKDFYVAAGVLLGIECFFLALKFIRLDSCFDKCKESDDYYNDFEKIGDDDEEQHDEKHERKETPSEELSSRLETNPEEITKDQDEILEDAEAFHWLNVRAELEKLNKRKKNLLEDEKLNVVLKDLLSNVSLRDSIIYSLKDLDFNEEWENTDKKKLQERALRHVYCHPLEHFSQVILGSKDREECLKSLLESKVKIKDKKKLIDEINETRYQSNQIKAPSIFRMFYYFYDGSVKGTEVDEHHHHVDDSPDKTGKKIKDSSQAETKQWKAKLHLDDDDHSDYNTSESHISSDSSNDDDAIIQMSRQSTRRQSIKFNNGQGVQRALTDRRRFTFTQVQIDSDTTSKDANNLSNSFINEGPSFDIQKKKVTFNQEDSNQNQ